MNVLASWVQGKSFSINRMSPSFDDSGSFDGFYRSTSSSCDLDEIGLKLFKANPAVFACVSARAMPFSEARFQMQEINDGRPGRLFDDPSLRLLDNPWPNGTTGELLMRMEQDVSLGGNFYATVVDGWVRRLRPDRVHIVSGVYDGASLTKDSDLLHSKLVGYLYDESPTHSVWLNPDQVVHYSPLPDPDHPWRGMSWLTPLVDEVGADDKATTHKLKFFENGAALSTVIRYPADLAPEAFTRYVQLFEEAHRGPDNAYRTLHIGGGADPSVIGTELKDDFRSIQAAGENRIAAAAGVGAVMARFTDGLSGSSLNEGNYKAAKRQFADMTLRPLWRSAAGALTPLVKVPDGARLWVDTRDVELLKENEADEAEIVSVRSQSINTLVTAGYTPVSAVAAVESGDLTQLEHSGLYSVQLQETTRAPVDGDEPPPSDPADIALMLQKIYLSVGVVINADEARELLNRAGAGFTGPAPSEVPQ